MSTPTCHFCGYHGGYHHENCDAPPGSGYAPRAGTFVGRPPCARCGAAYLLHHGSRGASLRTGLPCPEAWRPDTLAEAERRLAAAVASGDPERIFVARGEVQRMGGRP